MSSPTRTRAHPRLEARRAAVRGRPRWRAWLGVSVLLAFTVGGLGWLAVRSSLLDLETVEVHGTRRVRPDDVRRATRTEPGEPLLLVDRGAVAERVERIPWVREADVGWSLPGTLVVRVLERAPAAWIALGGDGASHGIALLDRSGRVLELRDAAPPSLPEIRQEGDVPEPGRTTEEFADALTIASAVPDALRGRVVAIERAADGFELGVEGAEVVRFGPATDVTRKWVALEAVLEELAGQSVYLVDVRLPSAPAVREREEQPEPEPAQEAAEEAGGSEAAVEEEEAPEPDGGGG